MCCIVRGVGEGWKGGCLPVNGYRVASSKDDRPWDEASSVNSLLAIIISSTIVEHCVDVAKFDAGKCKDVCVCSDLLLVGCVWNWIVKSPYRFEIFSHVVCLPECVWWFLSCSCGHETMKHSLSGRLHLVRTYLAIVLTKWSCEMKLSRKRTFHLFMTRMLSVWLKRTCCSCCTHSCWMSVVTYNVHVMHVWGYLVLLAEFMRNSCEKKCCSTRDPVFLNHGTLKVCKEDKG